MTDKMLIDRSVLEQASKLLQALSVDDNYGYAGDFRYWENYEPPEKLASTLRAALEQPQVELERIEQYRLQMAAIMTAVLGYWKEGDSIHPDYDTVALRDAAKLYAKYDELFNIVHGIGGEA